MPSDLLMCAPEVEQAVLGAALLDPVSADRLIHDATEADFAEPRNRAIYRAILDLAERGTHLSDISVQQRLTETGELDMVGGVAYIASMDVYLPDLAAVPDLIRTLHDRALRREGVDAAREFAQRLRESGDPADSVFTEQRMRLEKVQQAVVRTSEVFEACDIANEIIQDLRNPRDARKGATCGIAKIDTITGGLMPGRLYVLAGRPGTGKTAFAAKYFQRTCMNGGSAAFQSIEMGRHELIRRMLSTMSGVDHSHVQPYCDQQGERERIVEAAGLMEAWKAYISDKPIQSPLMAIGDAKKIKLEHGLDLLIVDYLQLMASDRRYENRNLEVAAATRAMKTAAKELDCPILLLSQLNREAQGKRPTLANLRDSGAIEADADVVMFMWCPNESADDGATETWQQTQGKEIEIDVAKNRHGPIGSALVSFHGWTLRFHEIGAGS